MSFLSSLEIKYQKGGIMEAIQIRFECEKFKKLMLELNPNVMVDFTVFDVNEHLRDMEGNNGNQSK